jgi:hypothetical protein
MTVRTIIISAFIIGLGFFFYSLTLPYYKDQKAANALLDDGYINKQEYYKKEAELRTRKTTFMDLGTGIAIASATMLIFFFLTKINNLSDFKKVRTLSKSAIFISANLAWLALIPGTYWYYFFRGARGDYPPFADSVGIPIMTQTPFFLFLLIPLNIFLFSTTIKTNLPTQLWIRVRNYSRPTVLWEFFFGFWFLVNLLCFVGFVVDGDHFSILVNLVFTYLLLSLRSGKLSTYE